jgi:hypothetical protein
MVLGPLPIRRLAIGRKQVGLELRRPVVMRAKNPLDFDVQVKNPSNVASISAYTWSW